MRANTSPRRSDGPVPFLVDDQFIDAHPHSDVALGKPRCLMRGVEPNTAKRGDQTDSVAVLFLNAEVVTHG